VGYTFLQQPDIYLVAKTHGEGDTYLAKVPPPELLRQLMIEPCRAVYCCVLIDDFNHTFLGLR
jgi:hypothetical protein